MSHNEFASSPLITPDRLERESLEELFRCRPEWALLGGLARPDEGLTARENAFIVRLAAVGKGTEETFTLCLPGAAILFELTRFPGTRAVPNANRETADPTGKNYFRIAFGAVYLTVQRLIMDAHPGQQVMLSLDMRRDLRREWLIKTGGRTNARKAARETAMRHARNAATAAGADADAYIANLRALFDYHDAES
jgi:hypothetical protein